MSNNKISKNRLQIYFVCILVMLSIMTLFSIKTKVTTMQLELHEVRKQIFAEDQSLKTLRAEYAYLSSPSRIKFLSEKYLDLRKTEISQLRYDLLKHKNHFYAEDTIKIAKTTEHSFGNNWRYKKGSKITKYIMTVSKKF